MKLAKSSNLLLRSCVMVANLLEQIKQSALTSWRQLTHYETPICQIPLMKNLDALWRAGLQALFGEKNTISYSLIGFNNLLNSIMNIVARAMWLDLCRMHKREALYGEYLGHRKYGLQRNRLL